MDRLRCEDAKRLYRRLTESMTVFSTVWHLQHRHICMMREISPAYDYSICWQDFMLCTTKLTTAMQQVDLCMTSMA